jgi:hypothetical protein
MSLAWSVATGSVYDELTATLNFNDDDTNLVYIDWDDGESNKLSEANYQWIKTPDPSGALTAKHTYTAASTFYPVVQTVTSKGFVSRYYSAVAASATDITPHTTDTGVSGVVINDSAATAIMRVENRTVKSGIDNSIFDEGPKLIHVTIPPLISKADIANVVNPKLEIEVMLAGGLYDSTGSSMGVDIGRTYSYKKLSFTVTGLNTGTGLYNIMTEAVAGVSGASVVEVLSVKYLNPRPSSDTYANYDIYNKLKLFIVASGTDGIIYPITYVSAGSPYKKTDDLSRFSTLDFSQGRAAASNKSISYYRYDNGKAWFNPVDQWAITAVAISSGNTFTNATRATSPLKKVSYTYMPQPIIFNGVAIISSGNSLAFSNSSSAYWFTSGSLGDTDNQATRTDQFAIDDFGRFYEQYHYVRNSVEPNSSSTYTSILSGNKVQAAVFQPASWGPFGGTTQTAEAQLVLSPNSWANGSGTIASLEAINTATIVDRAGNTNKNAKSYIHLLVPKKTNKFFFNFSNYAQGLQYSATSTSNDRLGIGGIYYLHVENSGTITQNCFWRPLEFEDTTKVTKEVRDSANGKYSVSGASFAKSGYITFDMPSDWDAISWKTICGGVYNDSGSDVGAPAYWVFPTASTDIDFTGTRNASGTATGFGDCLRVSGNEASTTALQNALTVNQMGAWKYTFYCTGGAASGAAYWIASGASNGWDGSENINIHFGERVSPAANSPEIVDGAVLSGRIRRINAYEVMDGAWKGTSGSTNIIIPVGLTDTVFDQGANTYVNNTWNGSDSIGAATFAGSILDWDTEDLYPLKIVLDGKSPSATATGTIGAAPILNNIFAANEAYTALIKEIDDSGYSLNTLPITSDISYSRAGNYYTAITRKGRVFIAKTGIQLQQIGFSSVALGDEGTATVSSTAVDSLYGYLHKVRRLYEENVRVYWDHKQKDGTYVRLWGMITGVEETSGTGGPRSVTEYSFEMVVEEIALLDNAGELMTDIFPLGGVKDERNFT